ncbi:MAG: winged helix-turn-helix transcriptional regulator [Nitrospira sp.]|nr:winged helix-turn-helix transcriptional regulator [bacterium]MBL7049517.1 winged helix-turn-helix transcriptional regulator [Nitrospira sp.]
MSLLFNNPEEKFYVREIARLVNKNPSGVKRELDKLQDMELVSSHKEGNLRYITVNRKSPLFPELKGLIAKSLGLPGALKSVLNAADAKTAFIHGPYVNNTDLPSLDILVVCDTNTIKKSLGEIEKRFGKEIHHTIMSVSDYNNQKKIGEKKLKKIINAKKILLLGRL